MQINLDKFIIYNELYIVYRLAYIDFYVFLILLQCFDHVPSKLEDYATKT